MTDEKKETREEKKEERKEAREKRHEEREAKREERKEEREKKHAEHEAEKEKRHAEKEAKTQRPREPDQLKTPTRDRRTPALRLLITLFLETVAFDTSQPRFRGWRPAGTLTTSLLLSVHLPVRDCALV